MPAENGCARPSMPGSGLRILQLLDMQAVASTHRQCTFQGELMSPSKDFASAPPELMMPPASFVLSLLPCCLQ